MLGLSQVTVRNARQNLINSPFCGCLGRRSSFESETTSMRYSLLLNKSYCSRRSRGLRFDDFSSTSWMECAGMTWLVSVSPIQITPGNSRTWIGTRISLATLVRTGHHTNLGLHREGEPKSVKKASALPFADFAKQRLPGRIQTGELF